VSLGRSRALRLAVTAAAVAGAGRLAGEIGLPSGYLFAAILVGIVLSLGAPRWRGRTGLPAPVFPAAPAS